MLPPRPLTVLRLKKLWPHARKQGHAIGDIWRVGYYNKRDGLNCIWLVDKDGVYARTADFEWVADKFEVIQTSGEKSLYGQNRPSLGPLLVDGIALGEQAVSKSHIVSQVKANTRFSKW